MGNNFFKIGIWYSMGQLLIKRNDVSSKSWDSRNCDRCRWIF